MNKIAIWFAVTVSAISMSACGPTRPVDDHFSMENIRKREDEYQRTECSYAPFSPREAPRIRIFVEMQSRSNDPNNTYPGSIRARCFAEDINKFHVCGVTARKNAAGYIDNVRTYYGVYTVREPNFTIIASGSAAETLCRQRVFAEPPAPLQLSTGQPQQTSTQTDGWHRPR